MLGPRPVEVCAWRIPFVRCYFPALPWLPQEDFELLVPAERTVQLAYQESCAYTDFVADSQRSSRVIPCDRLGLTRRRGHVFDGDPARLKLLPQKAAFFYRVTSRWGIFGGAFLVQQFGARQPGEVRRD